MEKSKAVSSRAIKVQLRRKFQTSAARKAAAQEALKQKEEAEKLEKQRIAEEAAQRAAELEAKNAEALAAKKAGYDKDAAAKRIVISDLRYKSSNLTPWSMGEKDTG